MLWQRGGGRKTDETREWKPKRDQGRKSVMKMSDTRVKRGKG